MIAILFLSTFLKAQTLAELTRQKKTQIKYLLEQIAANKIYIEYLQKGFGIAQKGLNTIQNFKKGDFDLHRDFIGSLSKVNPKIKSYGKVADIIAYQLLIVKNAKNVIKSLQEGNQFSLEELDYSKAVFERLLDDCLKSMDKLFLIITPGELKMKDDERIKNIDQLYLDMQNKYAFCQSFSDECSLLAMQRISNQIEIRNSTKLTIGL
jgi:hypothetical protein